MRVSFTWLCALSPVLVLLTSIIDMVGFRLHFSHWPGEGVTSIQQLQKEMAWHGALVPFAILFSWFALIPFIVTLIHHRQLGFRTSHVAFMALAFVTGWIIYFALIANVQALQPLWMD